MIKLESILIVDDTPKNLQVLGNTLKNKNYKVEFAINGFQALDWIEKKDFDLVLLDVMMPEMDGYEVCKRIRSNPKHNNLPIIFLTAKTDTESIVTGFEIGAQDYITKPFNTSELLVRVNTQLELKEKKQELERINNSLEEEVKRKTIKLQESYKKLEEANTELLGLDKTKTEFISLVTNELRVPLDGIMAVLHLLKDKIDSKEIILLISELDKGLKRLEKFSSYALLLTSLKTHTYVLKYDKINASELFDFIILKLANTLKENKVRVEIELDDNFMLDVDRKLFSQAIINIIEELIVYGDFGNEILISNTKAAVNQLLVSGNGKEFSDEILSKNFEEMENTKSAIGMGFSLAYLIFKAHFMDINLNNNGERPNVVINLYEKSNK